MKYAPVHPSIAHLTSDALDDLVSEYLSGTRAATILQNFGVNVAPGQLRSILPLKFANQACFVCGTEMVCELPTRRSRVSTIGAVVCPACRHELTPSCRCRHCRLEYARKLKQERAYRFAQLKITIVAEQDKYPRWSTSFEEISLSLAVAYLALCRCCQPDEDQVCHSLAASAVPFAPTDALLEELVGFLQISGLIAVSERSASGAVQLEENKIVFDLPNVKWQLRLDRAAELSMAIESASRLGNWPSQWHDEVAPMWLALAMSECRQFFDYCARVRGLRSNSDYAITCMLLNLLQDMSVGQCYRVIWFGARAAADFLVRTQCSRAHAANFMIGACQRWADHARTESWNVVPFKRNFDLPRSMISYVLFDVILKIGECGFTEPVGKLLRPDP